MRRSRTDWGAVGAFLSAIAIIAAVVGGIVWAVNQPTCYGIEPDGEVETLWPCPAPHKDGDRFPITEDQYENREAD